MPAVVAIYADAGGVDGSPALSFDLDANGGMQFRTDERPDLLDDTNPLLIPATPSAYTGKSFWVHLYLKVISGVFGVIDRVDCYSDGVAFDQSTTGIAVRINSPSTPVYRTQVDTTMYAVNVRGDPSDPGAVEGVSGNSMTQGVAGKTHPYVAISNDLTFYTSSSPRNVGISSQVSPHLDGFITSVNQTSNYVVIQAELNPKSGSPPAQAGSHGPIRVTWRWQET